MYARYLAAAGGLCIGLAIAAIAWPRFVSGAVDAPYEDTLRTIARGTAPTRRTIDDAVAAAKVSLSWQAKGLTMNRIGAFELVRAGLATTPADQRKALADSAHWLQRGLTRSPASAYSWLQLAQALQAQGGATPAINHPLRMSLRTAPFEHRLVIPRIEVAFRTWSALDADIRDAMTTQIRRAIDTAPKALANATRRNYALRQVRQAVAGSPIHRDRFNIVYLSRD